MKVWREEVEEHAEMNEEGAGSKVERRRLADAGSRKGISSEESTERVVLTALFPRPRFARENPSAVLIFVLAMLSIFLHGLLFRLLSGEDRSLPASSFHWHELSPATSAFYPAASVQLRVARLSRYSRMELFHGTGVNNPLIN